MYHLKDKLLELPIVTQASVTLEELKDLLRDGKDDVVVTLNPMITPRRLQATNTTNGTS